MNSFIALATFKMAQGNVKRTLSLNKYITSLPFEFRLAKPDFILYARLVFRLSWGFFLPTVILLEAFYSILTDFMCFYLLSLGCSTP
jgi:hypothetical protein